MNQTDDLIKELGGIDLEQRVILLGGVGAPAKRFVVTEQSSRRARQWRERLGGLLSPILNTLPAVLRELFSKVDNTDDLSSLSTAVKGVPLDEIVSAFPPIYNLLMGGIDEIGDLVISFDPAIEEQRDWILEHTSDRLLLRAFGEVLKVAFPLAATFGAMGSLLNSIGEETMTDTSSPNGTSTPSPILSTDSTHANGSATDK